MAWKSKYKGSEVESLLDTLASGAIKGGGIEIVDSVDKLDPNAEVGSMASVVTAGSIQETSFRNLYQPDMSMLDQTTGTLTQPELLSSISSIKVFAPTDVNNIGFEPVDAEFFLATKDFSLENGSLGIINVVSEGVFAMIVLDEQDLTQEFIFVEYSSDTNSFIIHNDQIEEFNAILANGMDWCYYGHPLTSVITEEQFNTLDLFIKAVVSVPSIADIYVKGDEWGQLYKKDFERLASNLDKTKTTIESKADKITITSYNSGKGLQPNVYTTYTISSTGSVTINLAAITDTTIYNEYILELKCENTPSNVAFKNVDHTTTTIVWANGVEPVFVMGYTYIISIANGLGVHSMFPNS